MAFTPSSRGSVPPPFSDVRHACATLGIDSLTDFTNRENYALFKGVYYHPLRKGQEWCFIAKHRPYGGIAIKRVSRPEATL